MSGFQRTQTKSSGNVLHSSFGAIKWWVWLPQTRFSLEVLLVVRGHFLLTILLLYKMAPVALSDLFSSLPVLLCLRSNIYEPHPWALLQTNISLNLVTEGLEDWWKGWVRGQAAEVGQAKEKAWEEPGRHRVPTPGKSLAKGQDT